MKSALIAVGAALLASVLTLRFAGGDAGLDEAAVDERVAAALADSSITPRVIAFTAESDEDSWLRGRNNDGSPRPGPANHQNPLIEAGNAVCFLTKVEFQDMSGAEDTNACSVSIDDFTGWWQINAVLGDGSDSSLRCNARCVVWE